MNIEIFPYKILIYYDIPELFIAQDKVLSKYLCLKTTDGKHLDYLTIPISEKKLNLLQSGQIDLRDAFMNSELGFWLIATCKDDDLFYAERKDWISIPDELLPDKGFSFPIQQDFESVIIQESSSRYNTILHVTLADEPGVESVKVETLADSIKAFQSLIKYTYKKEISHFKKNIRDTLDQSFNYTLRAFASTPGSFNIHLESAITPNLFGETNIERALEKIDQMIEGYKSEQDLIELLKEFKGHSVNSLRKLLEIILRDSVHFKYAWTTQRDLKIRKNEIRSVYATQVVELLKSKSDLAQEIKELIGYVHQADIDKGNWRIFNIEDEKDYSGSSEQIKLDGITLETIKYKFICEEIVEEFKISGKEEVKYKLISFEALK